MGIFLIAEIGSTHDGSFGNAKCLIDVASEAGVDAVKFQMHIAETETLADAPAPSYFKAEPRMEYFQRTSFSAEHWAELKAYSEEKNLVFLCSPFSVESVDRLERLGIAQYKIPSGEVTNLPMLAHIADTGKPILLSSGMSTWAELDAAVETIRLKHDQLTVLQCTTEYPCQYEHLGLNVMLEMRNRYNLPVGLSDHTLTNYAPIVAATLGASVIEKHITLSRRMYGSDAQHSLEPADLTDLVKGVRATETMLESDIDKDNIEQFRVMKDTFEKSVVSTVDIPAGTVIERDMLGIKKPGTGVPARQISDILGRTAVTQINANTLIAWSQLKEA
ncbi:N-acetylneuraminate synthase family protein [Dehalococcoidia bacterium]|nr:N-acetylneuraminate synthase family protein [Dehalococcoidia bacterium]